MAKVEKNRRKSTRRAEAEAETDGRSANGVHGDETGELGQVGGVGANSDGFVQLVRTVGLIRNRPEQSG